MAGTETAASVRFPQCKHRVCPTCFREIMFWDETRHHMSSVPFGCPPCPNGCSNPVKGKQCNCDEYSTVQEQWKLEHPARYAEWEVEEQRNIESPRDNEAYASKKCPFCRATYDRLQHGSMTGYTRQMSSMGMPPLCYVCRKLGVKKCSACRIATYCSSTCQKKHWLAGHSKDCKDLSAA